MPTKSSEKVMYSCKNNKISAFLDSILYIIYTNRLPDADFCTCADEQKFPFGNSVLANRHYDEICH